jgi:outer membrane protein OmpA-like peptidoglycan-associated protein
VTGPTRKARGHLTILCIATSACASQPSLDAPMPSTSPATEWQAPAPPLASTTSDIDPDTDTSTSRQNNQDPVASDQRVLTRVPFRRGDARLREDIRPHLFETAVNMVQNTRDTASLEGHCAQYESTEYCLHFAERRARNVKRFLVNLGVSESRLNVVSYGRDGSDASQEVTSTDRVDIRKK